MALGFDKAGLMVPWMVFLAEGFSSRGDGNVGLVVWPLVLAVPM
jgi:hypothetical protein